MISYSQIKWVNELKIMDNYQNAHNLRTDVDFYPKYLATGNLLFVLR
jgi:hypothetical protein